MELITAFPKFENLEIKDTCFTNLSPLSYIFEFETEKGRQSVCLQRPWRTNDWIIDECTDICKENEIDN